MYVLTNDTGAKIQGVDGTLFNNIGQAMKMKSKSARNIHWLGQKQKQARQLTDANLMHGWLCDRR